MGRLRWSSRLIVDRGGSAAAEMAMVMPLLLVLMFGSFEVARYFLDEHVVLKAVRDGARYAARHGFANYPCNAVGPGTVNSTVEANTRNVVRYGKVAPAVGDVPRLGYWNATITGGAPSVTVTVNCANKVVGTETMSGLYRGPAVPIVTVNAIVEFRPMFGALTMGDRIIRLTAESQATVMGR